MNAKEELQSLAPQDISKATRAALLSASAAETCRICDLDTHFLGAWLEEAVPKAYRSTRPFTWGADIPK